MSTALSRPFCPVIQPSLIRPLSNAAPIDAEPLVFRNVDCTSWKVEVTAMADQGISNRESPQEERRERDEFPPRDPGLRDHNKRSDEKAMEAADESNGVDESENDDQTS
jgi:hypothetical protein